MQDPIAEELSNMISDMRTFLTAGAAAPAEDRTLLMQTAAHLRDHFQHQLVRSAAARQR